MVYEFINMIRGMRHKSYLELGVGDGRNFEAVKCRFKTSVDTNGRGMFTCSTDEFFAGLAAAQVYDVIFIDANHDLDFVLRDFNHAVAHCRAWVLIHDLIPPSEKYTAHRFCSDGYKLLYYFWRESDLRTYSLQGEFGLTFVQMPAQPVVLPDRYRWVSYAEFAEHARSVHLYDAIEIGRVIGG